MNNSSGPGAAFNLVVTKDLPNSSGWGSLSRAVMAVVLFVAVLSGLAQASVWSEAQDSTVIVAVPSLARQLDPGQAFDVSSQRILSFMFEPLVFVGSKRGHYRPGLAESWSRSPDGLIWTFKLRSEVYFHDGSLLTATVAANSFRRFFDPKLTPSFSDRERYYWCNLLLRGNLPLLREVKALDKRTLQFHLHKPIADFLEIMASPAMAIISKTSLKSGSPSSFPPVGTGPFRFVEMRPNQRLTLRGFAGYWNSSPFIDNVVIVAVPEAAARQRELLRGNCDVALGLPATSLPELRQSLGQDFFFFTNPAPDRWNLFVNCSRRPFSDVRTRLALQYALPKPQIMQRFAASRGQAAYSFINPKNSPSSNVLRSFLYDATKSRRLINRVYGGEKRQSLSLLFCSETSALAEPQKLASYLVQRLQDAGLPVKVNSLGIEDYYRLTGSGNYDLAIDFREMAVNDADFELSGDWANRGSDFSEVNLSNYSNVRLQNYLLIARTTSGEEKRRHLYTQIEGMLAEDGACLPIGWVASLGACRRSLSGFKVDRLGRLDLSGASYND